MLPRSLSVLLISISLSAPPLSVQANEASPLEISLQPELRVMEQHGKEVSYRYAPAHNIQQGQEIYYTVRIVNVGNESVRHAVVVQPIPLNTHYVARSATGAGALITFSIDGGKSFVTPDELQRARNQGAANASAATAKYTHIRWQLRHSLAPHAVALARFRVVFE